MCCYIHNSMTRLSISLFWPSEQNRLCRSESATRKWKTQWKPVPGWNNIWQTTESCASVFTLAGSASPAGRTKFSQYYENSFVDFLNEGEKKTDKRKTKPPPWSRSFIINSGSMKGNLLWPSYKNKNKQTFSNCLNDSSGPGCQKQQICAFFRAIC